MLTAVNLSNGEKTEYPFGIAVVGLDGALTVTDASGVEEDQVLPAGSWTHVMMVAGRS